MQSKPGFYKDKVLTKFVLGAHPICSGNQTDDRRRPANHKALQKLLQRVDFIEVADNTQKAEHDAEMCTRRLQGALEELRKMQSKINTYHLQEPSADCEARRGRSKAGTLLTYEIHATREYQRFYWKKGRPNHRTRPMR